MPWNATGELLSFQKISQTQTSPPIIDEEELKAIFERTYGVSKREKPCDTTRTIYATPEKVYKPKKKEISARDLLEEILITNQEMREEHLQTTKSTKQYLFEGLSDDMADFIDDVRLGRREFKEIEKLEGRD